MGTDDGDGDRILRITGIALAIALLAGLAVIVLAGANVPADGETDDAPNATWTVERVNQSYVEVVHAGGEPIERENLVVSVNSKIRQTEWSGEGAVVEGDRTLVRIGSRGNVKVYWDDLPDNRALLYSEQVE